MLDVGSRARNSRVAGCQSHLPQPDPLSTVVLVAGIGQVPHGSLGRVRAKDAVGHFGEQVATDCLLAAGLEILERNWRCAGGEIDIIACEREVLVFVEVKTRSTLAFGSPAEAVSPAKAARVRRLAAAWLCEHRGRGVFWPEVRFDVVSVVHRAPGPLHVQHLRGAF